jgi:hypothetical protein
MAIGGVFTPVLAKHSKSFSLIDCIRSVALRWLQLRTGKEPKAICLQLLIFPDQ